MAAKVQESVGEDDGEVLYDTVEAQAEERQLDVAHRFRQVGPVVRRNVFNLRPEEEDET